MSRDQMTFCERCGASLTSTDYDAGTCTQCGFDLIADGDDGGGLWDDEELQLEHELRREELSK